MKQVRPSRVVPGLASRAAALALAAAFAGCAQIPRQPITQQPMTAVPPVPPQMQAPGSIYNPGYAGRPLFEDQRPRNIGDILTIMIAENVNATKSSGANANRGGSTDFNVPTAGFLGGLFNKANLSASGSNKFTATGGATAANTFSGTITVTVTNVLPNGNLLVAGERSVLVRGDYTMLRFSGIVDPKDLRDGNVVASVDVAQARVEVGGKGDISEAASRSWLQRVLTSTLSVW